MTWISVSYLHYLLVYDCMLKIEVNDFSNDELTDYVINWRWRMRVPIGDKAFSYIHLTDFPLIISPWGTR
jgi:hypothetical protein